MSDAVEITRLPSGLLVVTESMSRVETVSIGAYVAAGTRNEDEVDNGASHFLEHMRSRAPNAAAPPPSPSRSRTSAAISTPTRRGNRPPTT